jgi:transcriptional regulator of acetoin/glycerol metabolism
MSSITPYFKHVLQARHLFFEEGLAPSGLVDDAVWRSWQRCLEGGRHVTETTPFNMVEQSALAALLERNHQLVSAAEPAIVQLAETVSGTGYGVLLTDELGTALAVHGPIENGGRLMRQALRPGVDLSERAVGTTAMTAAIAEKRPVGVFGAEHFFTQNHAFQCAAAPIFDPAGKVVGSIDITRDSPSPHFGALSLVIECATAIETTLFLQIPTFITVRLTWCADESDHAAALLSFGGDGEVLAANMAARRLLGLDPAFPVAHYRDLFHGSFSGFVDQANASDRPVQLRLHSGLQLFARHLSWRAAASVPVVRKMERSKTKTAAPEFGDTAIAPEIAKAQRALRAALPVLITGETGTGKEVAARALHADSANGNGPFVAINCAAIPKDLIEGELFGYADGAYTGARRGGAKGKLELADGGTLFLDEIGDMPLELQTRLLRVLENREITRLGDNAVRKVELQLISATHQDLQQLIAQQQFRQDLYFRLHGYTLNLPPLRARNNLAALIDHLMAEEEITPAQMRPDTREILETRPWPGNTRELRSALRFAKAMAGDHEAIGPEHLPSMLPAAQTDHPPVVAALSDVPAPGNANRVTQLKELESQAIADALSEEGGNIARAARRLGISRATLHRWKKKNS